MPLYLALIYSCNSVPDLVSPSLCIFLACMQKYETAAAESMNWRHCISFHSKSYILSNLTCSKSKFNCATSRPPLLDSNTKFVGFNILWRSVAGLVRAYQHTATLPCTKIILTSTVPADNISSRMKNIYFLTNFLHDLKVIFEATFRRGIIHI